MILQTDPEMIDWVLNLEPMGAGDFLKTVGLAAQRADFENYILMRPMLLALKRKYPHYSRRAADREQRPNHERNNP